MSSDTSSERVVQFPDLVLPGKVRDALLKLEEVNPGAAVDPERVARMTGHTAPEVEKVLWDLVDVGDLLSGFQITADPVEPAVAIYRKQSEIPERQKDGHGSYFDVTPLNTDLVFLPPNFTGFTEEPPPPPPRRGSRPGLLARARSLWRRIATRKRDEVYRRRRKRISEIKNRRERKRSRRINDNQFDAYARWRRRCLWLVIAAIAVLLVVGFLGVLDMIEVDSELWKALVDKLWVVAAALAAGAWLSWNQSG